MWYVTAAENRSQLDYRYSIKVSAKFKPQICKHKAFHQASPLGIINKPLTWIMQGFNVGQGGGCPVPSRECNVSQLLFHQCTEKLEGIVFLLASQNCSVSIRFIYPGFPYLHIFCSRKLTKLFISLFFHTSTVWLAVILLILITQQF